MRRRIRSIKPEWLTDQKLGKAGLAGRVLSVALVTMADDDGRGVWIEHVIAAEVFGYEKDPLASLREGLTSLREWFVQVYEVRGETYFAITHWTDHQKVDRRTPSRLPAPPEPVPTEPNPSDPKGSTHTRDDLVSSSREAHETATSMREFVVPGSGIWDQGSGIGGSRASATSRGTTASASKGPESDFGRYARRFWSAFARAFAEARGGQHPSETHHARDAARLIWNQATDDGMDPLDYAGALFDLYFQQPWAVDPTKPASVKNFHDQLDRLIPELRLAWADHIAAAARVAQ